MDNESNDDEVDDNYQQGNLITQQEDPQDLQDNQDVYEYNCKNNGLSENFFNDGESDPIKLVEAQRVFYSNAMKVLPRGDDVKVVKRYVKEVYRNMKFPSDDKHDFHQPAFVLEIVEPLRIDFPQTITLANYLMSQKEPTTKFDLKGKIYWWKGYRDIVRKEMNRLRQAEVRAFKARFVNSKLQL